MKKHLSKFWKFLQEDSWQSLLVSLVLLVIIIRFILFPLLSFVTGSPLPLVVIESCSLYHDDDFDSWWTNGGEWYEDQGISKEEFREFNFNSGLNKGDIIFVWGRSEPDVGDIIIFNAGKQHPIIHRIVDENPLTTKGDNWLTNSDSADFEKDIPEESIIGKATLRVPFAGWLKLIFFEPLRPSHERGTCAGQMKKLNSNNVILD